MFEELGLLEAAIKEEAEKKASVAQIPTIPEKPVTEKDRIQAAIDRTKVVGLEIPGGKSILASYHLDETLPKLA